MADVNTNLADEEAVPLAFGRDGREIFVRSSVASDTLRIVAIDLESGRVREIARMDGFDAEDVMMHPTRRVIADSGRSLVQGWCGVAKAGVT